MTRMSAAPYERRDRCDHDSSRGDGAARAPSFAEAAERHLDDVYRYVLVLTRDPSLAEDLAAETFERALRMWRRFDPTRSSARTWLCTIARSDRARPLPLREATAQRASARCPRPNSRSSRRTSDCRRALERALAALSAADREVVALRVVLELDAEATARHARHQRDGLHDAAQPCPETTRGVDER